MEASGMGMRQRYKTWIEINRRAVAQNVRTFRSILRPRTRLFAVVKSNAYGHGLLAFSEIAARAGVDGFCVDSVVEGYRLRAVGIRKPILVLGPTLPNLFAKTAGDGITITVSHFEVLRLLRSRKVTLDFHIKVDTGMHRQGFYVAEMPAVLKFIQSSALLSTHFRGIYTHFAAAKDVTYPAYTLSQVARFERVRAFAARAGFRRLTLHASATGGAVLYPRAHYNLVRVGIGLYGYWPTEEVKLQHRLVWGRELHIEPILGWYAVVSEVKQLHTGDFVGYDLTERVERDVKMAIIPIGYWHGFPRSLSSRGEVLVNGRRLRVLGRVSMDLITVAVPRGVPVHVGDRVTLIGHDRRETIDATSLAALGGTISYELLTRLNPLIARSVVNRP